MRRPVVSADSQDLLANHFLARICPQTGVALGEMDLLLAFRDHFMGQSLDVKYAQILVGGTSTITLGPRLNGQVRLRTDTALNNYAWLRLGDAAAGYNVLDADEGFVMIMRSYNEDTSGVYAVMHAYDITTGEYIAVGAHTGDVANNWMIRCNDGVGSFTDSGVALDTDWHIHAMEVGLNDDGNNQVDYKLDGALIASQTTNIPTGLLTPGWLTYVLVDGDRKLSYIDWVVVAPRNLV